MRRATGQPGHRIPKPDLSAARGGRQTLAVGGEGQIVDTCGSKCHRLVLPNAVRPIPNVNHRVAGDRRQQSALGIEGHGGDRATM